RLLPLVLELAQGVLGLLAIGGGKVERLDVAGLLGAPARIDAAVVALVRADRAGDAALVAALRGLGDVGRQTPVIVGHGGQRGAGAVGNLAPGVADLLGRLGGEFGGAPGEVALGVLFRRRVALLHRTHAARGVGRRVGAVADAIAAVRIEIGLRPVALEVADQRLGRAGRPGRRLGGPVPDAAAGGRDAGEPLLQGLDLLRQLVDAAGRAVDRIEHLVEAPLQRDRRLGGLADLLLGRLAAAPDRVDFLLAALDDRLDVV